MLVVVTATAVALTGALTGTASAQNPDGVDEIDVQAAVGEPLGVGKIIVRFAPGRQPALVPGQRLSVTDGEERILYPTYSEDSTVKQPGVGRSRPDAVTAFFLFRGDRQLRLTLDVNGPHHGTGIPVKNPEAHAKLLAQWWKSYSSMVQGAATADNGYLFPPQVENYLSAMLAAPLQT